MMIGALIPEGIFFGSAGILPAVAGASCPRGWRDAATTAALRFRDFSEWRMV